MIYILILSLAILCLIARIFIDVFEQGGGYGTLKKIVLFAWPLLWILYVLTRIKVGGSPRLELEDIFVNYNYLLSFLFSGFMAHYLAQKTIQQHIPAWSFIKNIRRYTIKERSFPRWFVVGLFLLSCFSLTELDTFLFLILKKQSFSEYGSVTRCALGRSGFKYSSDANYNVTVRFFSGARVTLIYPYDNFPFKYCSTVIHQFVHVSGESNILAKSYQKMTLDTDE